MYCSRCGDEVGIHDHECTNCGANLGAPGAIRLTNPRLDSAWRSEFEQEAEQAAAEESARAFEADATAKGLVVVHGSTRALRPGEAAAAEGGEEEDASTDATDGGWQQQLRGRAGAWKNAAAAAGASAVAAGASAVAAVRTAAASNSKEAPADDAAGVDLLEAQPDAKAEPPAPQSDASESHGPAASKNLAQMLGIDLSVPAPRVMVALLSLLAAIVILVLLMGQLMNMDRVIMADRDPSPTPSSAAAPEATESAVESATPTEAPAESGSPTPSPTPTPSTPQTPSMVPNAKECNKGVWAGPETSCALANEVGKQVDVKKKSTQQVKAFSPSSNREYALECKYTKGFTCTGLEGVNVNVWVVA